MAEKTVPWWRRALHFALDGIRSGFGLFSRHDKHKTEDEPEQPPAPEENPLKEAELTEDSPRLEEIVETAHEAEAVPAPVPAPEVETGIAPEPDAVPAPAPEDAPESDFASVLALEIAQKAGVAPVEPVAEPAPEPPAISPDPQPAPKVEAAVETLPADELVAETAPEETAEESPAPVEAPEQPATEAPIVEDTVESPEPEAVATPLAVDEAPPEPESEAVEEPALVSEPVAETTHEEPPEESPVPVEAPVAPAAEPEIAEVVVDTPEAEAIPTPAIADEVQPETVPEPVQAEPEPVEEMSEPADPRIEPAADPEPEAAAEPEAVAEPAAIEEPADPPEETPVPAHELAPEAATASVESMEPALEDGPGQSTGQPAAEEAPIDEETPADEPEQEIPPAAVLDAVEEAEPASPVKEFMESTPEQIPEPAAADQTAPLENLPVEQAASEPVPTEETLETVAVESVIETAENGAAEPDEETFDETAAEPVSSVQVTAHVHVDQPAEDPTLASVEEPAETPTEQPAVEQAAEEAAETPLETVDESTAEPASEPLPEATAAAVPAPPDDDPEEPAPAPPPPAKPFIKLESRDNEADLSPFSVVVSQVYDGPLDLLLDLIRKQDIDIYDIPISRITAQFLAYVNQLKATDVDVAGEFIYMASLLIHIKSKMLLPRAPSGPDDAPEDPRRELVERLLEHERFKSAAQMLQQKQMLEAASWSNPGIREFQDDAGAEPEIAADTVDLVRIFRDILERASRRPVINLQEDSVTVGQMIQFLSRRLTMEDKPVALRRLLSHTKSERALIAMFLALLELVRLQAILLRQDRLFSEIFIKKHIGFEAVMNDGLANSQDDWK